MDDLVAWLTQVWDEQEKAARFAHELAASIDYGIVDFQWVRFVRDMPGGMVKSHSFDTGAPSPAEVLARIAVDRQILALHKPGVDWLCRTCCGEAYLEEYWDGETETTEWKRAELAWPCPTVRLLAQPYADRPGFRDEWRVTA